MPPLPTLAKRELFERLSGGAGARVSVVTPNLRLAHELAREFDAHQLGRGLGLWDAPDIVPYSAFVARAYEDALYSDAAGDLPAPLPPAGEQALWEDIVARSAEGGALLAVPQTASAARDAWKTAHEWRLMEGLGRVRLNEDAEAFSGWSARYARITQRDGHTESARLPDLVARCLAERGVRKPALLVRYGFDIVTPQQQALFEAFAAHGSEAAACFPAARDSRSMRVPCVDARDEIRRAARWARSRLEARPGARIGVVVPDLAGQRNAVRRTFAEVLGPGPVPPFNISLGEPLSSRPLVDCAFMLLELAGRGIAFERASRLLRSPFIAAGESELAVRARLDAALRRFAGPDLGVDRLVALVEGEAHRMRAPVFAQVLGRLAEFRKARLFGAQAPSGWARAFSEALALAGFPGERGLDSVEYQALGKWHETLAAFARLERVVPRLGYAEAVARLRRIAADTAFQPESQDVPIQVLGVLESAGCEFDHLWVMGLSVEAWPLAARPNPFLPLALQRAAGLPESSADASLELDRRITQGWKAAAGEVVFSHPTREADRELGPSPLIATIPEGALELPAYPGHRERIFAGRALEAFEDAAGPAHASGVARGGAAVLGDQAACPFRAFARHRLGAGGLDAPHAGLDAMERGTLVHAVLAHAWRELGDKGGLDRIADAPLQALLERAAAAAVAKVARERPGTLEGRFALVEARRLARLAGEWLQCERGRGDFRVAAIEDQRTVEVGGLRLDARLDRVDETAGGARVVIDYKTGKANVADWVGARPEAPQLPLYLTAAEPGARAIAFAQVRRGEMKFAALAAESGVLAGARTLPDRRLKAAADSWGAQLEAWRIELEGLARAFVAGEAAVDPKGRACDYCDLQPLCRVGEAGEPGDGGEEAGDPP